MFDIIKQSSTRIKTAIVLIVVIFGIGIINNPLLTWGFLGIILLLAGYEIQKMLFLDNYWIYTIYAIVWVMALFYPNPVELVFVILLILASIIAYNKRIELNFFIPFIYPLSSFLFIFTLYRDFGIESLLWLLVIVASADIGAYFVGKSKGKRQFCKTSPNKTIEGVMGGILFATIAGAFFITHSSLIYGIIISFFTAIASIFGDLFESYLKREANIKDSSNILPGHGGILDRIDGYLFASVVLYMMLKVIN